MGTVNKNGDSLTNVAFLFIHNIKLTRKLRGHYCGVQTYRSENLKFKYSHDEPRYVMGPTSKATSSMLITSYSVAYPSTANIELNVKP